MKEIYEDSVGRYIEGKRNVRYYEQNCQQCTNLFFPKRKGQKYCSQSCNVEACRERNGYVYVQGKHLPSDLKQARMDEIELTLEKITGKLKQLDNKILGVNVDGVKSTVVGNAIYNAGASISKNVFGVKSGMEKDIDEIKKLLASIQSLAEPRLTSGHLKAEIAQAITTIEATGNTKKVIEVNSNLLVEMKEYILTNGETKTYLYKPLQSSFIKKKTGPSFLEM